MITLIGSSITITPASAQIALGSTLQLTATATGKMSDGSQIFLGVKWASECPAIATVDPNTGLVTATNGTYPGAYFISGGTVNITATALRQDGSPIGSPAICPVIVLGYAPLFNGLGKRNSSLIATGFWWG